MGRLVALIGRDVVDGVELLPGRVVALERGRLYLLAAEVVQIVAVVRCKRRDGQTKVGDQPRKGSFVAAFRDTN